MRPGTLLRWHALKHLFESEVKDDSVMLDIGGYDGEISYRLKNIFPSLKIAVVDVDQSGLKLASERGLNTLCASVLELPIEDERIDFILCLDLIEHVKKDDKLVKEISRVLKKNGKVILTTPMQNGVSFPFLSKQRIEAINKSWEHVRNGYSLEEIKELFQNNNLNIIKTGKYFNFFSRTVYCFSFLSKILLKGKSLLYRMVVRLEPYISYGSKEHIIIGKKEDKS